MLSSCAKPKFLLFDAHNPLARLDFPLLFQVPSVGLKGGLVVACKLGTDIEPVVLNNHQISFLVFSDPGLYSLANHLCSCPLCWDRS
jgi:hypothetical protein